MDEIITFQKSFSDRFQEYCTVFENFENTVLPASRIKSQWSCYLELAVDVIGWQAVWKIPRLSCESLKIPFPSVVLVIVLDINFKDLNAVVRVLAVQDDISIPDVHLVPLIQLWPTKSQDKTVALNIEETANSLDMLRFFYLYLFMPWDMDSDDMEDWKSNHLENRLRLYYDMKNGIIPHVSAEHIHSLLTEARRLQSKREVIESRLRENEENPIIDSSKLEGSLLEIHIKLMEIHTELDILENPLLREVKIKRQLELLASRHQKEKQIWLLIDNQTADECIKFLHSVKKYYPSEKLTFSANLGSALETANFGDVFILSEAEHHIRSSDSLDQEGVLLGIGSRDRIIVTTNSDDVMFDLKNSTLENITINAVSAQCAVLVRKGKCTLKNCKINGDSKAYTHQGIIVLAGAELELVDCEISDFPVAIVGNSGAAISMRSCTFRNIDVGVKIFDKCKVEMHTVNFRECHEHAVVLETEVGDNKDNLVGNFEILKIVPDIILNSVNGSDKSKGDVAINQKNKLKPVEDLFSNPDLDPTILGDDEAMDCNKTLCV